MSKKSEESKIKTNLIVLYTAFGIVLIAAIAVVTGYIASQNG